MVKRPNRGHTKGARKASYRADAVAYVENRDAEIDRIVAEAMRQYPRANEAEIRAFIVAEFVDLEAKNDVRNTVRSNALGFDERELMDQANRVIRQRIGQRSLSDVLSDVLRAKSDAPDVDLVSEAAPANVRRPVPAWALDLYLDPQAAPGESPHRHIIDKIEAAERAAGLRR